MIGLGVIAPYFLAAIEQDNEVQLTAVCDLNPAKFEDLPDNVRAFTDYRELLGANLVDAVVVTLPNDQHFGVVADALRANLHVCCEKPLTVHSADAQVLQELALETDRTLFTAFHRRYNSHVQWLARSLPDRSRILRVRCRYHERIQEHSGSDHWYLDRERCGGGCIIDNGPNALDAVRQVLGELKLVDATIGSVRAGVEFYAELELVSQDGIPVAVQLDWELPTGEIKDITVELDDGSTITADMLAGYDAFKSSLTHEYKEIIAEFRVAIGTSGQRLDDGLAVVELVEQAYSMARSKEARLRMPSKKPVSAVLVKALFHRRFDRGMSLSAWSSRCVRAGDIHELVTTTELPSRPDQPIDMVGFLGFVEFETASVIEQGDQLWLADTLLGVVVGFDECHAPNHYNVLINVPKLLTAEDMDLRPGDVLRFKEKCVS